MDLEDGALPASTKRGARQLEIRGTGHDGAAREGAMLVQEPVDLGFVARLEPQRRVRIAAARVEQRVLAVSFRRATPGSARRQLQAAFAAIPTSLQMPQFTETTRRRPDPFALRA